MKLSLPNIEYLWLPVMVAIFFILQNQFITPKVQVRTDFVAPPIELKYLNAGFATQMANSFWLRAMQDIDHCNQPINEKECKGKSWLFSIVNLVVELDQKFREAYYYGALSLTIIISDYAGASIIFDKGVDVFSKDWQLLYAAGYHAFYEEKDKLKTSRLYLAAAENGGPSWLRLTAGRLATEGGDDITSKMILQQLVENEVDPIWIEKLRNKIKLSQATK